MNAQPRDYEAKEPVDMLRYEIAKLENQVEHCFILAMTSGAIAVGAALTALGILVFS